jgi:hypothetical protein
MTTAVRGRAMLVLVPLIALLTAGCVSLPATSVVTTVSKQANTNSGSDVRIWPHGPQGTDTPETIVEGFLQAASSDPTNLTIAQSYLTGDALKHWDSGKVIVFSDESSVTETSGQDQGQGQPATLRITGTQVATVSDDGVYQAELNPMQRSYEFRVVYDAKNGYRIDSLPDLDSLPDDGTFGVALSPEAFRSDYTAYYLYYLNQAAPATSMIPVPVYLRSQTSDTATAQSLAENLLKGPPESLGGAASNAASKVALVDANAVTIGPSDTALVAIKTPNACTLHGGVTCSRLADQLMASFSALASVNRVTVVDPSGKPLGNSSTVDEVMKQYHVSGGGSRGGPDFYYLDAATRHVFSYDGHNGIESQVGGPELKYAQLAVTRYTGQSTIAAMVDTGGTRLYLGTPGSEKVLTPWTGHHLSSLSWDALGHLWFLDTVDGKPQVYRLDVTEGLQAKPREYTLTGVDGGSIRQLAAAPDGRRIAVVYSEPESAGSPAAYSIGIAIADAAAPPSSLNVSYGLNQPVANVWTNITGIDWHGSQSLAVLGYELPSSPLAISELNPDGSAVVNSSDQNTVTINPPKGATGIEWAGGTLLASYTTGSDPTSQKIEQYLFTTNSWSALLEGVNGTAPSYFD